MRKVCSCSILLFCCYCSFFFFFFSLLILNNHCQARIPCVVAEKYDCLDARSRDWNMGLHWGASSLKSLLPDHLWDRIQSIQVDSHTPTAERDSLNFYNAQSGEVMASIPVQYFYRLRRRKLRVYSRKVSTFAMGRSCARSNTPRMGNTLRHGSRMAHQSPRSWWSVLMALTRPCDRRSLVPVAAPSVFLTVRPSYRHDTPPNGLDTCAKPTLYT